MKKLSIIPFILMYLVALPSWGETMVDLVERDGIYYKKFSDIPFTGEVEGRVQVRFKNGKREGSWVSYWDNGQLREKGDYKNGKREGRWVRFLNTDLMKEFSGVYKDGVKISD